jgi:hypothetical protein
VWRSQLRTSRYGSTHHVQKRFYTRYTHWQAQQARTRLSVFAHAGCGRRRSAGNFITSVSQPIHARIENTVTSIILRRYQLNAFADLYEGDHAEFDARVESGRRQLFKKPKHA